METRTLCPIGKLVKRVDEEDKKAILEVFSPTNLKSFDRIVQDMRKNGHRTSLNTVVAHYHGYCACYWEAK